ncbi:hypothetical protein PHYBLDRAFT_174872 [Phycomyces blakesleeanus NRRL 1555(-)]|uniref:Uncharacterized protein n=1 Tax=Phycomyces blakesleeanus (strain ATCC 8743b / DSM 1359 / FGSC 10004 / NBRC 33097 / NRRL 1555) TaxID=763407 RepID=A0A162ZHS2_PHYB8|nr:hypothetical protein PHYBLDRAFT_174872 [Phycomyces blakesleeanus NRRL 1555(-)]OAD66851.1 hypothetical protein PHYBLDRAFT_174872 [Phycomyces blakesleeanus NRRL 1555(-)]|eukprot:XP_018284891.1 hypothetical protein PHYBLDRAFT_174872 [Phycomyces blakesleeanus NRRL 1555(-)]
MFWMLKLKNLKELSIIWFTTYQTDSGQSSRLVVSWKIAALIEEDPTFNSTNRILLVIRKIAEVLPRFIIEDGPQETELITQYLHPALVPLFENIDELHVTFKWTPRQFHEIKFMTMTWPFGLSRNNNNEKEMWCNAMQCNVIGTCEQI